MTDRDWTGNRATTNTKDWTGNKATTFKIIGASNHCTDERESNDFYATDPSAIDHLMAIKPPAIGGIELTGPVWEPACGQGHLSERLKQYGYEVYSTDLIDRGYGDGCIDFLKCNEPWDGDILTNPPYKYALEFAEHGLDLIGEGHRVFLFMKLTFLEGQKRRRLFDRRELEKVLVFTKRIICAKNADFDSVTSSAMAYAWFVFRKGYNECPEIG